MHNAKLGTRTVEIAGGRCTTDIELRPELVGDPHQGVLHGGVARESRDDGRIALAERLGPGSVAARGLLRTFPLTRADARP